MPPMTHPGREMSDRLDAVVVGAGISGLAAAFTLARNGAKVAVLEAAGRVGGVVETRREGGFRFELGPNTVLDGDPAVGRILAESGLATERIIASPEAKRRYIWQGGRLVPLPAGPGGFLTTRLFPLGAKLRLLREPWIGRPPAGAEESIARFVRRRLGQAFLDRAVGPFVSGVWAGDPERLSVRWAIPKIAALESEHGSLIRGALARRKGAAPRGGMISFPEGLEELPRRLAREVGDVRTGVACTRVARAGDGFRVETAAGALASRRVVLAVPADAAARLLAEATNGRSLALADVPYAAVAVVGLGFRRADVAHPLDGFGFLAPRQEGLRLLGCLFTSSLFPGRAPEGHVALAAFLGGRTDPEAVAKTDDRILAIVGHELRRALGVRDEPVAAVVRRWPRAIPQYELGHGRFVELVQGIEAELPGLAIAGNFTGGVSVPDCLARGIAAGERLLRID